MPDNYTPIIGAPVSIEQKAIFNLTRTGLNITGGSSLELPFIYTEVGRTRPATTPPNHPAFLDPALFAPGKKFDFSIQINNIVPVVDLLIQIREHTSATAPTCLIQRHIMTTIHASFSFYVKSPLFQIIISNRGAPGSDVTTGELIISGRPD